MKRQFRRGDDGAAFTLDVEPGDDGVLRVRLPEGGEHAVRARRLPGGDIEITEGERTFRVPLARGERGALWLAWEGAVAVFTPVSEDETAIMRRAAAGPRSGVLAAPMVGVIANVAVAEGDRVAAFQKVAVVEAMKVFATVEAPFAGIVRKVHVRKGDRVEHGAPLVEIAPDEEGTTATS